MALPASLQGNLRIPVVGSPMYIVSGPELVTAQCKAGVVGSFPALNARPQEELDVWITRIKDDLGQFKEENPDKPVAPFAVNQICHNSNNRLFQDMETCVKHEVPVIITSLRPPGELVEAAHAYGGVVFHDVINVKHARKAAAEGVDGLILVCAGAGGHAGTKSPFALVRDVREWFDGTILLSGAISDGASIASALALGADAAYIGSRFIATEEARAVDDYKQMVVNATADDIVYTDLFSGVLANYLRPSVEKLGLDPENLPKGDKKTMDFKSGGENETKVWRDIWSAGQGVGQVKDAPAVQVVVDRMADEFAAAANALTANAANYS